MQPTDDTKPTDDAQADGYYDEDMGSDELDLSFLDEDEKSEAKK